MTDNRRTDEVTYEQVQQALRAALDSDDRTPAGHAAWTVYAGLNDQYREQEMRK